MIDHRIKLVKERETYYTIVYSEVGTEVIRQLRIRRDAFNGGAIPPVLFVRITDSEAGWYDRYG